MTSKVIEGHKSSSNFSVNQTLPLMISPHYVSKQISLVEASDGCSIYDSLIVKYIQCSKKKALYEF